jgi:hypothetical protein
VQAGFHYYEAFPEEIDRAIAENQGMGYERLKRLFPQIGVVEAAAATAARRPSNSPYAVRVWYRAQIC